MTDEGLIKEAESASRNSYSPYSGFKVGAALLGKNGKVYRGANVESASYGAAVCAERAALCSAVTDGCLAFEKLAVYSGNSEDYVTPCGICRQSLYEFSADLTILCSNSKGEFIKTKLSDLLPRAFSFKKT